MKIAEDTYKIEGNGNVYLILNPVPTLIDVGNPSERDYIKSEIEKIIPLDKIKIILLTHLHYDHSGNVDLFPNAKFYAAMEEIEDFRNTPQFFYFKLSEEANKILKNKLKPLLEEISEFRVIGVPGHTRGSVAFLDEKRKLLYSGDTVFEKGIGRTDLPTSVPDEMKHSVDKIINLIHDKDLMLCPGHDY